MFNKLTYLLTYLESTPVKKKDGTYRMCIRIWPKIYRDVFVVDWGAHDAPPDLCLVEWGGERCLVDKLTVYAQREQPVNRLSR